MRALAAVDDRPDRPPADDRISPRVIFCWRGMAPNSARGLIAHAIKARRFTLADHFRSHFLFLFAVGYWPESILNGLKLILGAAKFELKHSSQVVGQ
jgi:hypothetical protein